MLVKRETATFRGPAVRAGYVYDDVTLDVVSFWCENETGLKMTMTTPDRTKIDFVRDGRISEPVKTRVKVDSKGDLLATLETGYTWR